MLIAWKSFLINCVSLSSAEAELYALSELLKMARHISYVARDLGIDVPAVLPLETVLLLRLASVVPKGLLAR